MMSRRGTRRLAIAVAALLLAGLGALYLVTPAIEQHLTFKPRLYDPARPWTLPANVAVAVDLYYGNSAATGTGSGRGKTVGRSSTRLSARRCRFAARRMTCRRRRRCLCPLGYRFK